MRDPKRIPEIMEKITNYWGKNPDLRFWQVIEIIKNKSREGNDSALFDPFYIEDFNLMKILKNL